MSRQKILFEGPSIPREKFDGVWRRLLEIENDTVDGRWFRVIFLTDEIEDQEYPDDKLFTLSAVATEPFQDGVKVFQQTEEDNETIIAFAIEVVTRFTFLGELDQWVIANSNGGLVDHRHFKNVSPGEVRKFVEDINTNYFFLASRFPMRGWRLTLTDEIY